MNKSFISPEPVDPCFCDKFSPNFYRWLLLQQKRILPKAFYHTRPGTMLYIGRMDDGDFIGCQLHSILSHQPGRPWPKGFCSPSRTCWITGEPLVEVPGLWEDYLRIGQCAFDPDHCWEYPPRTRYKMLENDLRECLWCGKTFRQTREIVRKTVTKWVEHIPLEV